MCWKIKKNRFVCLLFFFVHYKHVKNQTKALFFFGVSLQQNNNKNVASFFYWLDQFTISSLIKNKIPFCFFIWFLMHFSTILSLLISWIFSMQNKQRQETKKKKKYRALKNFKFNSICNNNYRVSFFPHAFYRLWYKMRSLGRKIHRLFPRNTWWKGRIVGNEISLRLMVPRRFRCLMLLLVLRISAKETKMCISLVVLLITNDINQFTLYVESF